jgi:hypothetical protein
VIYYGDEQGMVGSGNDNGAREDMFSSQAPRFRNLGLLGTSRTGKDDKFDVNHPFYRTIRALAGLRESHPGLSRGAMILRDTGNPRIFAFSRVEREERVEYLVALSNSRSDTLKASLQTCQRPGARLNLLFDSASPEQAAPAELTVEPTGRVTITLKPLQLVVFRASVALIAGPTGPAIRIANPEPGSTLTFSAVEIGSQVIPKRQELLAVVEGGDGFAEVTFALRRASRPGQYELVGTADRPPYRVFWRPPADLKPGETLSFMATVDDLRGHRNSSEIDGLTVAPTPIVFGIRGATVPLLTLQPEPVRTAKAGADLALEVAASGTLPIDYAWLHDGRVVRGANRPFLRLSRIGADDAGLYTAILHNREGTAISHDIRVQVAP